MPTNFSKKASFANSFKWRVIRNGVCARDRRLRFNQSLVCIFRSVRIPI